MPNELRPQCAPMEASPPLAAAQSRPESGTLLESLRELREILGAFEANNREEGAPQGAFAVLTASAAGADTPEKTDPVREELDEPACEEADEAEAFCASLMARLGLPSNGAAASPDALPAAAPEGLPRQRDRAALMARLGMPSDGAIAPPDPLPAAPENPPQHRTGAVLAALAVAGVVVLGATGLVMTRGPDLHHLMASAADERSSPVGLVPAARAALPPPVAPAMANGNAASRDRQRGPHGEDRKAGRISIGGRPFDTSSEAGAPARGAGVAMLLPTVASAPPAASERAASAWAPGGNAASAVPTKPVAPRRASAAPSLPRSAEPAGTAPSAVMPGPADRSAGRQLREAGDARTVEGDIASARLFYERAADAGDAQAALDLGNSFNPAFLERLGVLGIRGDVVAAARWYRRARTLGAPDAARALQTLSP
jgi:hypothetical protein